MSDDTIYVTLLILSIPIGLFFNSNRHFTTWKQKAWASSAIGFVMVLITCYTDFVHSLLLSVVNALLLYFIHPKYVATFSFIWCFGYLFFFRTTHWFGLPKPVPYANAVQLVMTLKLVGLAFEIHDSHKRKVKLSKSVTEPTPAHTDAAKSDPTVETVSETEKLKLEVEFCSIEPKPKFYEMILYSYCYVGILTGPYFKYRTYKDWLVNTSSVKDKLEVDTLNFLLHRGKSAPFIILGFLILSMFVSFKDATLDEFYENTSFWYRILYMILIFSLFRFRFYIAWIFAEFACMTASFGVYPAVSDPKPGAGPTNLIELKKFYLKKPDNYKVSFKTVNNIDEYHCEMSPTVKQVLHYWNMTVQYWMANFVYKRVTIKAARQPLTMALSAYWHGLHPGYYLSMLTTTPCIIAENLMDKGFKRRFLSEKYYKFYDFGTWIFRTRLFDYMSMGFMLLTFDLTMKFWSSIYFVGHLACLVFIVLGYVLIKTAPRRHKEHSDATKTH